MRVASETVLSKCESYLASARWTRVENIILTKIKDYKRLISIECDP